MRTNLNVINVCPAFSIWDHSPSPKLCGIIGSEPTFSIWTRSPSPKIYTFITTRCLVHSSVLFFIEKLGTSDQKQALDAQNQGFREVLAPQADFFAPAGRPTRFPYIFMHFYSTGCSTLICFQKSSKMHLDQMSSKNV